MKATDRIRVGDAVMIAHNPKIQGVVREVTCGSTNPPKEPMANVEVDGAVAPFPQAWLSPIPEAA